MYLSLLGGREVANWHRISLFVAVAAGLVLGTAPRQGRAQLLGPGLQPGAASQVPDSQAPNPLTDSTMSPGKMQLFALEARFEKDVVAEGGAGFAAWFADDGVALGNGKPPLIGEVAIAQSAKWSPQEYQLTWTPTDAMMSPDGDMGYTWGHYEGRSKDAHGNPVLTSGRYITVWRKQPDGSWKVVLDAGADDAPAAGDCCKLPTP